MHVYLGSACRAFNLGFNSKPETLNPKPYSLTLNPNPGFSLRGKKKGPMEKTLHLIPLYNTCMYQGSGFRV